MKYDIISDLKTIAKNKKDKYAVLWRDTNKI